MKIFENIQGTIEIKTPNENLTYELKAAAMQISKVLVICTFITSLITGFFVNGGVVSILFGFVFTLAFLFGFAYISPDSLVNFILNRDIAIAKDERHIDTESDDIEN